MRTQIVIEQVHGVVNGFFSGHVNKPRVEGEANARQNLEPLFHSPLENELNFVQLSVGLVEKGQTLGGGI